ncbi:hypothetical protein [Roseobacter litoralis]|uniref:hypothetical protein n=1 Tax=Roseobacter litoralis TaxID=42443 RepID=UPI002492FF0F|nr:hypothetical protein [Roseobacter litoralis]
MINRICLLITLVLLTACTYPEDLNDPPVDLGNFRLEHNIVVAPLAETSTAISRSVTEEQLTTALRDAIAARFDRYEGSKRYHLGVSIEGYILARAGVPVVAAPKSAMIIRVTVWDDAQAKKLNVPPEQMTILENIDGESLIGTGWTQSAEKQLEGLARNAAKSIENFLLRENEEKGWFKDDDTQSGVIAEETDTGLLRDVQSEASQTDG